jgi:hypothetical protein
VWGDEAFLEDLALLAQERVVFAQTPGPPRARRSSGPASAGVDLHLLHAVTRALEQAAEAGGDLLQGAPVRSRQAHRLIAELRREGGMVFPMSTPFSGARAPNRRCRRDRGNSKDPADST